MTLNEFIERLKPYQEKHRLFHGHHPVRPDQIPMFEQAVGATFGPELTEFLLHFSYIVYPGMETFGIYSNMMLRSDLVRNALDIQEIFPWVRGLTPLMDEPDYEDYLVDKDDWVYAMSYDDGSLVETGMKVFDFLLFMLDEALSFEFDDDEFANSLPEDTEWKFIAPMPEENNMQH